MTRQPRLAAGLTFYVDLLHTVLTSHRRSLSLSLPVFNQPLGHVQHYLWNVLKDITSRAFIVYLFVFLVVMLSLWRGSTHYSNYSESGGQARRGPAGEDRGQAPCWDGGEWNDWLYCHQHLTIIITAQPHTHTHHTPLTTEGREGRFSLNYSLASLCSTNQIHQLGNWEFCLEFPLDVSASLLLSILSLSVATLVLHLKITAFTKQTVNHMYVNIKSKIFSIILLKFSYKIHHLNYDNLMYHSWNNRKS